MALSRSSRWHCSALATLITLFSCLDEYRQRRRIWGAMQAFAGIFVLMMPGRRSSYQLACGLLYDWAGMRFGWTQTPDPSGLQRARKHVTVTECERVYGLARAWADEHVPQTTGAVGNRPLIAVDGTILHLPRSGDLVRRFGVPKDSIGRETAHYPQGLLVSAWDVGRRLPIAWSLHATSVGEREALLEMLPQFPTGSVVLLDRGYPSREVVGALVAAGHDVVLRMVSSASCAWSEVTEFRASGKREARVEIAVGIGRSRRTISARLIRRVFGRGRPGRHQSRQEMVLLTTLTEPLDARDLCRLYGDRWGVETMFREMKSLADIERWHGKTRAMIDQELTALMTWFTIAAVIQRHVQDADHAAGRPLRRANSRRVFEAIAYVMESLFMAAGAQGRTAELLRARANEGLRRVQRWAQQPRPGRSASRKPKHPYARSTAKSRG